MRYYKAKHLFFILPLVLATFAFIFFEIDKTTKKSLSEAVPFVTINGHIIKTELALNREEQAKGLSDRPDLCRECGMLFVFGSKQVRTFWMKNMHFPLDIIWIDKDKIVKIDKNLPPEGEFPDMKYSSLVPVDYVLEVNSGFVEKNGIKEGDKVEIKLD